MRIPKAMSLDDSSALHIDYDEYLSGKDRSYVNLTDHRDQANAASMSFNKAANANSFSLKPQHSNGSYIQYIHIIHIHTYIHSVLDHLRELFDLLRIRSQ